MVENKINSIPEQGLPQVDYSQFKNLQFGALNLPPGTLVRGVPASALLTSRQALEQKALSEIAGHFRDGRCLTPVPASRVIVREQLHLGLVSDSGIHIVGAALVNRIKRVDVLLQPQEERPSGISVVRSIREIAWSHKALLRLPSPQKEEACIIDIHQTQDGGLALELGGRRPFKAEVVSLEISDGKVIKVNFVDRAGNIKSTKAAVDLANRLPLEAINGLLTDPKG